MSERFFPVVVVHVLLDGGLARPEHVHELRPLEEDGALDEVPDGLNGIVQMVSNGFNWFQMVQTIGSNNWFQMVQTITNDVSYS